MKEAEFRNYSNLTLPDLLHLGRPLKYLMRLREPPLEQILVNSPYTVFFPSENKVCGDLPAITDL